MSKNKIKCWSCGKKKKGLKFDKNEKANKSFQSPKCKKCLRKQEERINRLAGGPMTLHTKGN